MRKVQTAICGLNFSAEERLRKLAVSAIFFFQLVKLNQNFTVIETKKTL